MDKHFELIEKFEWLQRNSIKSLKVSSNLVECMCFTKTATGKYAIVRIDELVEEEIADPPANFIVDDSTKDLIEYEPVEESDLHINIDEFAKKKYAAVEFPLLSKAEQRVVLLVGRSGVGKSSFANTLFGVENAFKAGDDPQGVTKRATCATNYALGSQKFKLSCIDSPGVSDPTVMMEDWLRIMSISLRDKRVNSVVFIIDGTSRRLSSDDLVLMLFLKSMIAQEAHAKHLQVVFSKIDKCDQQEMLPFVSKL